jgi:hypothetical protein
VSSMRNDDRIRLQHMLDAANEALSFVRARVRGDLDNNLRLVLSLVRASKVVSRHLT